SDVAWVVRDRASAEVVMSYPPQPEQLPGPQSPSHARLGKGGGASVLQGASMTEGEHSLGSTWLRRPWRLRSGRLAKVGRWPTMRLPSVLLSTSSRSSHPR